MRTTILLILCLGFAPLSGAASPVPAAQETVCSGCKAKLKPDAKFCTGCGTKVPQMECAGCKMPLKTDAKFCTGCGKKVEAPPAPKPEPKPAPKPEPKPDPKPEPKPAEPAPPKQDQPVGKDQAADDVKLKLDAELRKYGTSAEEVNRAIERGAARLAAHYAKIEMGNGEDYLSAYALIHTSQYHTNAKLREKIHGLLRSDKWMKGGHAVYCVGLRALALEATHDPDLKVLTRECAEYLVEAQGPEGTWGYQAEVPITRVVRPDGALDSALSVSGGEPLDEEVKGEEVVRKGTCKQPGDGDNSCTQFALLGLHAAAKSGYRIPRETWAKCLKEMEERHCKDGGWAYHNSSATSYGSMTCAGICSVALCRYYLGEKNYLDHEKLKAGMKWLAKNFTVSENPPKGSNHGWPLYYIYSVERVGVFTATEMIGEHGWYGMGAKHLVGTQKPDGSWVSDYEDAEKATSLALLFLTRATSPVKSVKRGGKGWLETNLLNDAANFMFILDASGSMREEMDGKEKFEIAKEVVESIVKKLPEGANVGLRVYGHRFPSIEDKADTDSELLIPVGPLQPAAFIARVRALKCRGKTPITHSLDETIKDVSRVDAAVELVTILLTDGGESTRGAKPSEAAARLAASRKGMKVHVVGFDISDDDWKEQLQKTAAAGNGIYFHALKASDLLKSLVLATVGEAEYTLMDKDGKELHKGKLGDRRELPEGKYGIIVQSGAKKIQKTVWINTDVVSRATVSLGKLLK